MGGSDRTAMDFVEASSDPMELSGGADYSAEDATLAEEVPSIWDSLSWGVGTITEAATAGSAAISDTWANTSDSRARIAVSVTETVRDAKDNAKEKLEQASCTITPMIQPGLDQARTQLFGQRPQNAVFGQPLSTFGGGAPAFLEGASQTLEQMIRDNEQVRFMFRPDCEAAAIEACDGAAELQMMVDEGETVDFTGCPPLLIVSLLVSYLWSLPTPVLPTTGLLDATAYEIRSTGTLSVVALAEAWGQLRQPSDEPTEGHDSRSYETRDVVLHHVLAAVKLLKNSGNAEEAHDYCLMLAPAIFQLDTAGSVLHSLQMVNAEAALFVLAEMV